MLDECCNRPQLLVRIPLAVCEHPGTTDAVFCDPENLGLGVLRAHLGKLRNRRLQRISRLVFCTPGSSVAAGSLSEVHLASGDEVLIGLSKRIGDFRCVPSYRRMDRGGHEVTLQL